MNDETRDTIARVFLNDAELSLAELPSTLQELIDQIVDHNYTMLVAIKTVDPDLHAWIHSIFDDGDSDELQVVFNVVNDIFKRVRDFLED
jgi:hypothetical protein